MKTLITYGTFDLLHVGHVRLLKRLRELSQRLVVGLSTDKFNLIKNKKCIISYEDRKEMLLSTIYVDHVFPEESWDQKRADIERENAHIFAMGDDWIGKFDDLSDIVKVIYLPRTPDISTTDLKEAVVTFKKDKILSIKRLLEEVNISLDRLEKQ